MLIGILRADGWWLVVDIGHFHYYISLFFLIVVVVFVIIVFLVLCAGCCGLAGLAGLPKACLPGHGDASCIIMAAGVL